jgi:hypothetical protein
MNKIPEEQAQELVKIMQSHKSLTTLCGLSRSETELDMSGKMSGAGDAIMLVPDIIDNGAMSSFTFGDRQAVTMTTAMTEANFSGKLFSHEAQMVAAFLPKCM